MFSIFSKKPPVNPDTAAIQYVTIIARDRVKITNRCRELLGQPPFSESLYDNACKNFISIKECYGAALEHLDFAEITRIEIQRLQQLSDDDMLAELKSFSKVT